MRRAVSLPSTSVPLSTVCAAQTWTNCPTFSPFLLFPSPPILYSFLPFPGFSPTAYGIFFHCQTLKTLARKTDMWNFLVFKWAKGGKKAFMADVHLIPLFFCSFWPKELRSRWKNAAPKCKSGPCLLQTFCSLTPGLNVKHLLNSKLWTLEVFIALNVFWFTVYASFSLYSILSPNSILFASVSFSLFTFTPVHSMQFSAAEPY